MKSRPVFYVPTMDIFEFLADTRGFLDSVFSDPAALEGLPPETVARYRAPGYAAGYAERYPNFDNLARRLPALRENLRKLHAAGVPVALGTDMWAFPGLGVSIELDLFVKAGLSPSRGDPRGDADGGALARCGRRARHARARQARRFPSCSGRIPSRT